MKLIYSIFIFLKDLKNAKSNRFYSGQESSYKILRFLYFISDGLLLKLLELYLFFNKNSITNIFKSRSTFKILPKVNDETVNRLKHELMLLQTYCKGKKYPLKFTNKCQELNYLDFEYYSKNKIVRLDFDRNQIIQNKFITNFIKNLLSSEIIQIIEKF